MKISKEKIINTFIELVKIDSPSGFESGMRNFLIKRLKNLGAKPKIDSEGNIFVKFSGKGEPLSLCAHMDTVEPGRNIEPVIRSGVIKSKGETVLGADNKAAVTAILEAISCSDSSKRHPLEIVFSVREETDGGINKFDFKKLKSKRGIVADASFPVGAIILSSPYLLELKIEILGKAAHAGHPEDGINALSFAASCLSKLEWGRVDKFTTANIGLVTGGSATNTVPGRVYLEGEIRSFSKTRLDRQLKKIKGVFLKKNTDGLQIRLFSEEYCAGYVYKKNSISVKEVSSAIKKTGLEVSFYQTFGGSDANNFNSNGIEMIDIGDGTVNSHTVNESVSVNSLINLTKILVNYISVN